MSAVRSAARSAASADVDRLQMTGRARREQSTSVVAALPPARVRERRHQLVLAGLAVVSPPLVMACQARDPAGPEDRWTRAHGSEAVARGPAVLAQAAA